MDCDGETHALGGASITYRRPSEAARISDDIEWLSAAEEPHGTSMEVSARGDRAIWLVCRVLPHEAWLRDWLRHRCGVRPHELDDVVQDTFFRLMNAREVDQISNIRAYMKRTAWSVIGTTIRRRKVAQFDCTSHDSMADILCEQPLPDRVAEQRDALQQFMNRLDALPSRMRTVVILQRIEDMSLPDIAARLGLSVSSIDKECRHALRLLREQCR